MTGALVETQLCPPAGGCVTLGKALTLSELQLSLSAKRKPVHFTHYSLMLIVNEQLGGASPWAHWGL